MALPYTFGTQSGTIPLNELDENFQYLENLVPPLAVAAATVTAAAQPNVTSLGTMTTLNCSGTITTGTLTANLISGVIQTASQPGITTIGTLTNLTVSDTILAGTVNATQITGTTITGTISTASQPGITTIGTLTSLTSTGNVTGGNINTAGLVTATGNVTGGNINTAGVITATGNITGGNLSTGKITATDITATTITLTGNVQGGNLRTTGLMSATGNVTGGNILTSGLISATGNITSGNVTSGNITLSGNVSGGNLSISGTSSLSGVATAPTAGNGTSNTQIATTAFVQNSLLNILPTGVIVMWSGSVASIPSGWLLCNGSSGTPDLRNRFIVGAGSTYSPGATGGSADAVVVSHTHTATSVVTDPGHFHSYTAPAGSDSQYFSGGAPDTTAAASTGSAFTGISVATTVASAGVGGTNANLPPYYALAYIMKA